MISENDFSLTSHSFSFRKDQYKLSNVTDARVKRSGFRDHILHIGLFGLLLSSLVWAICPQELGVLPAPIAFVFGAFVAAISIRKYDLQLAYQHADGTGLQWISVAKSNKSQTESLFDAQVQLVKRAVNA